MRCLRKFTRYFPKGYLDAKYLAWERDYKWNAHLSWEEQLNKKEFRRLLAAKDFRRIASIAVSIESRTNLLFSFEKMALRDAVKSEGGAKLFSKGLYEYLHGRGSLRARFEKFVSVIGSLPRRQTRVLTWPLVTVFGFIAEPGVHVFLKPRVTQVAAAAYDFPFRYRSGPSWQTYESLLAFADQVRKDTRHLHPRDLIDLQSFIRVMGSGEYP